MRLTTWQAGAPALALLITACAAAPPPDPGGPPAGAPTGAAPAASAAPSYPKLRLGHYSTADGMSGLVFDRLGDKPKVRLDGSKDIIELTPVEKRRSGDLVGTDLKQPDGSTLLFVAAGGAITLYRGPRGDALQLTRDADADPLGAPTVSGAPPPPKKLPYEVLAEELSAISVVKRMPQLKPEHAGNLAKVAEAIATAGKEMFVTYAAPDPDAARWAPVPSVIGGTDYAAASFSPYPGDDPWDKAKGGLLQHGGVLEGVSRFGGATRLDLRAAKGFPPPLAKGTPGLVWEMDSTRAVLVTLDGGRYFVSVTHDVMEKGAPLVKGVGAPSTWPPPLQHALVDATVVSYLAKAESVPKQAAEELDRFDDEWRGCARKAWDSSKKDFDAIKTGPGDAIAKTTRMEQLAKRWEEKIQKQCGAAVTKTEKSLVAFIEGRNKERLALFEKAKARLSVGK